jgi:hypothetical protein
MQKPESFEKFYYTKVGMGEACGCAERIIDVFEFNRRGGTQNKTGLHHKNRRGSLRSLAYKYGLLSRKRPG